MGNKSSASESMGVNALLQAVTLIFGTQTGCRRLDSYMELNFFAICAWIFCWVFSATGIFRRGNGKNILTGWARIFDLQIMKQIFYHCSTAFLWIWICHSLCSLLGFSGRFCSFWKPDFPAVSVVTCRDFLAVSAVTGSRISGGICSYLPGFSGLNFSGKGMGASKNLVDISINVISLICFLLYLVGMAMTTYTSHLRSILKIKIPVEVLKFTYKLFRSKYFNSISWPIPCKQLKREWLFTFLFCRQFDCLAEKCHFLLRIPFCVMQGENRFQIDLKCNRTTDLSLLSE